VILSEFDPAKPFYSLVLAYLCQVHGLAELISRGFYQKFEKFIQEVRPSPHIPRKQLIALFLATIDEAIRGDAEQTLLGGTTTLMLPLEMQAWSGEGIKWNVAELADTVFTDKYNAALRYFNRLTAGSLLVMAWEHVKAKHRRDPVAQFLRHCRNAAAHNGVFTFDRGQPNKPAEWHGISIVRGLEGTPLFVDPPRKGFFGPGDALYLLADIEKRFL
jgi:hypothetical protein